MTIPNEVIQEFIEIWEEEFGEVLTFEVGRFEANRFLEMVFLLKRPPGDAGLARQLAEHGGSTTDIHSAWKETMRRGR